MKKMELLAPAGSLAKAKVAFMYGADAVYAGTAKLSLRSRAEMDSDDLEDTIKYAHSIGKKVYVAMNAIFHNDLVDELNDKQAYLRGVFMMCGSINDPKTSRYHAEFVIQSEETANYVNDLLNEMSFKSKVIKRV